MPNQKILKPNSKQIKLTLSKLISILNQNQVEYRLLGSVVTAAIHEKLHRRLGDIDLIIDQNKNDQIKQALLKLGYMSVDGYFTIARKYLALETFTHPDLSSIGYFYGDWQPDGSILFGNKHLNVTIEAKALKPTTYHLEKIKFIGIPQEAIATGILSSKQNPKRKLELELINRKKITPFKNNYIHVNLFGFKADCIYHSQSWFLNGLGSILIKFGQPYDPWRIHIK